MMETTRNHLSLRTAGGYCLLVILGMHCLTMGLCMTVTDQPNSIRHSKSIPLISTTDDFKNGREIKSFSSHQPNEVEHHQNVFNSRQTRDAPPSISTNEAYSSSISSQHQGYYEEQNPVVIHSEAGPIAVRQPPRGPPDDPYYSAYFQGADDDDDGNDDANDYESNNANDYGDPYKRVPEHQQPQRDSDSVEDTAATGSQQLARTNQYSHYPDYDSYYRQRYFGSTAMPPPPSAYTRKLQSHRQENSNGNRNPYEAYQGDDYDYPSLSDSEQQYRPKVHPQQREEEIDEKHKATTLLSLVQRVKTMWDIYQSLSSAWNSIADRRLESMMTTTTKPPAKPESRINSKKPPKFTSKVGNRNKNITKPTSTTTTTSSTPPTVVESNKDDSKLPDDSDSDSTERPRRSATKEETTTDSAIAEGRYIKGDPLKGYYDFVITEGSYKFWAAFQVGTAILIIYSTFAAIYYSKVNPLVSDYDYVDYLGGGRSLSGGSGDDDFVDDDSAPDDATGVHRTAKWLDWLPIGSAGHTMKFILDAIDKLPHEAESPEDPDHQ